MGSHVDGVGNEIKVERGPLKCDLWGNGEREQFRGGIVVCAIVMCL